MSAKSQLRRSPFQTYQHEPASLNSLDSWEKSFPQRTGITGKARKLTAEHLDRPLPPLPPVSRRSSSVYSLENEDILDYYTGRSSKDKVTRSYNTVPLAEPYTREYLHSGRETSPISTPLLEQPSPILPDPVAEYVDAPSWMSSGPRFQYTLDHYAQLTLPNFKSVSLGTGFVAQSFDIPFDEASAHTSDRSVSPKSQPWERRPSLKSLPFAGQYRPPQECFSESSSVSSITRPVSPKSVPRSSTAVRSSQAHLEKPGLPSRKHIYNSVSPSSSTHSDRLVSAVPTEQHLSPAPSMPPNNHFAPPSSWGYLQHRLSDMYDTFTTLTISPAQKAASISKEVISSEAAHFRNRWKNSSSNPLHLSLSSRPHLKRPASSSPHSSRPSLRSPAVPITPYQYMGTKVWEDDGSPKGKKRRRPRSGPEKILTSPLHINRFASLVGKGKKDRKEEEAEKWRQELKKKIVLLGPGRDEIRGRDMEQDARTITQGMDWI